MNKNSLVLRIKEFKSKKNPKAIDFNKYKSWHIIINDWFGKDFFEEYDLSDLNATTLTITYIFTHIDSMIGIGQNAFDFISNFKNLKVFKLINIPKTTRINIGKISQNKTIETIQLETNYENILDNKKIKNLIVETISKQLNTRYLESLNIKRLFYDFKIIGKCKKLKHLNVRCHDQNCKTISALISMSKSTLQSLCLYIDSTTIQFKSLFLSNKDYSIESLELYYCLKGPKPKFKFQISKFNKLEQLKLSRFEIPRKTQKYIENKFDDDNIVFDKCKINKF